jgi:hypothetical protein
MLRIRVLTLALLVPAVIVSLRCGSDSPTGPDNRNIDVELEDYTDHHDDEAGELWLRVGTCSEASGGRMVKGLDYPGEWIEVPVTVAEGGEYEVVLSYAAYPGDTLRATVTVGDCSSPLTEPVCEFVMDKGVGVG